MRVNAKVGKQTNSSELHKEIKSPVQDGKKTGTDTRQPGGPFINSAGQRGKFPAPAYQLHPARQTEIRKHWEKKNDRGIK